MMKRNSKVLPQKFFERHVLQVAEDLIGKKIVREMNGKIQEHIIVETEAYDGIEDLACHASKGRTKRTEVMFGEAGVWYVYLVYGMHWMVNIVTGKKGYPAAVLIRGVKDVSGPGRVSRLMYADGSFTGKPSRPSVGMWFEEGERVNKKMIRRTPRIGIDYSGPIWSKKLWRFVLALEERS